MIRVWEIFGQMTRSLNHLHSRGIMHRDLKPENIFMNDDGSVRLGDFGLSKDLNEKTYATYAGTKAYMAPEGHLTKKLDLPSDIFSLGIIVFQLLTGQHPFEASSEAKIIDKIEKGEYQKIPNWVSSEMKKLVEQMLSSEPSKRPTTQQIMQQETIRVYLKMQEEKEKLFDEKEKLFDEKEQQKKQAEDAQAEITRLREQLANKEQINETPNPQIVTEPPKPKQPSTSPISVEYTPLNPSTEDVQISGDTFTHTNNNANSATILFDPVISSGVARIEFLNINKLESAGIADESVHYNRNNVPLKKFKTVMYWRHGILKYEGEEIVGNSSFFDNHLVTLELNMDSNPHSLNFFVDDKQQPNYVVNIPNSVRFYAYFYQQQSQFKVLKFERLSQPTSKRIEGCRALEWGKLWRKEEKIREKKQKDSQSESPLSFGSLTLIPLNPSTEDVEIEQNTFIHTDENENDSVVLFDPVISKGIYKIKILNVVDLVGVGIADQTVQFGRNEMPDDSKYQSRIVYYRRGGKIQHYDNEKEGNTNLFIRNKRVAIEINMDSNPRMLTFFVDDKEQPNFVIDIPNSVRFWAYFFQLNAQFKVIGFEKLSSPSAKHGPGSHSFEFGKKWK
ncbi:MAG: putative G2-specific protein kinase nim-1 [Streblomastix strix]|uniref:non-specific serine/threonine protein kinase n=1 Tax=Streblomastix strix TaxID=222440 RepID=A0A5J4UXG0_9EUKA|nr:MAG: putative G2-specific protein kinase nim-1 [Streblomastix strix]